MRVLVLSDHYPPNTRGGADIAAERLSAEIARRGHSVRVLTTVEERSRVGSDTVRGVQVRRVISGYPHRFRGYLAVWNPGVVRQVALEIARFRPDIVHAHNIHTHISFQALIEAKRASVPVVLTAHDHQLFCGSKFSCMDPATPARVPPFRCARCQRLRYFPLRNRLIRRAMGISGARVLAVSSALRDDLIANGLDPNLVEVAHNGIDPTSMEVSQERVRFFAQQHGLEGKKALLFGGRVSYAKGIDQAVLAIGRLPRSIEFVLLVLGSSEEYAPYLRGLARSLKVEDRVVFLPWLSGDDLKAAYALSDLCLTPSIYREPFNLINIEAMAMGRPVVTGCFGGPPEVVVDGVTGYVVDPRDTDLLASRLLKLLSDEALATSMGQAGHRRLLERFTVAHQADRTLSAYETAMGSKR